MNVDILADNPPWWYYAIFATTIMIITSSAWMGFKRYDVFLSVAPSPAALSVGFIANIPVSSGRDSSARGLPGS